MIRSTHTHTAGQDRAVLARILATVGAEMRRDADGVAYLARRRNHRGTGWQQAVLWQARAGQQVVRRLA